MAQGVQDEGYTLPLAGQPTWMYAFPTCQMNPGHSQAVSSMRKIERVEYPHEFILVIFYCESSPESQNQELSL